MKITFGSIIFLEIGIVNYGQWHLEGVRKVYRRCFVGPYWWVSGVFIKGVWKVSETCLEGVWKLS